jgi:hypothetical protein
MTMLRFRWAAFAVVAIGCWAAFASAALATAPTREPVQIPQSFPVEGICAFTVQVDVLVNREKLTTFSDGTQRASGALKVRLTNTTSGESIVVNASGPATFRTLSDGTVVQTGRGLGLQPFPAGASITGKAEFLQFSGPEMLEFYPDGSFKEVERGHVKLDVCAALS